MPELPEIETISQHLQKKITNYCIKQVIMRRSSLRWPINPELNKILGKKIIKNISRRAKYLLIYCYNQDPDINNLNPHGHLIIHLGMSGKLSILEQTTPVTKHDHVDFILQNNLILRYNDPRRFGAILWTTLDPLQHVLLSKLGPEPLDQTLTANYFLEKAKRKTLPIKQFIMDSQIVVGVGNIYASEALFTAKIHPLSITKNLTLINMQDLIKAIRKILKQAILQGGTTLKDFFDPTGKPGNFTNKLQIYGRANKNCFVCNNIIEQIKLGQRSTFFCKTCQLII